MVIPTDEERMIAEHTLAVVTANQQKGDLKVRDDRLRIRSA
jgi:hypothetical protein